MKNDKEIVGTLCGFDDFVNMVLEDVTEYESTPEGRRVTKLETILLNGNNITMVRTAVTRQGLLHTVRIDFGGTVTLVWSIDLPWSLLQNRWTDSSLPCVHKELCLADVLSCIPEEHNVFLFSACAGRGDAGQLRERPSALSKSSSCVNILPLFHVIASFCYNI